MASNLILRTTFVNLIIFQHGFVSSDSTSTSLLGADCRMNDSRKTPGKCKLLSDCQFAVGNLQTGIFPTPCIEHSDKITVNQVCCPEKQRISAEKCELYKNVLRYTEPFVKKNSVSRPKLSNKDKTNENSSEVKCETFLSPYISGGRDSAKREYPHQAALGYGSGNITWRCGGTLISEDFVLTAGHCVNTDSQYGVPVKVLLGDRRLSKEEDDHRLVSDVLEIIPHPEFKPPVLYNDIALIRLKSKVKLSRAILPACLPEPEDRLDKKNKLEVTGWGQLGAVENQSDILQSVSLSRFGLKECSGYFTSDPSLKMRLPLGIIRSQFCAGDKKGIKDSCRGDSGGPVVVNKDESCVYYVIGITSFGSNYCGYQQPGVYTNLQRYLDWIEDTVWPPDEVSNSTVQKPGGSPKNQTDFMFPYIKSSATPFPSTSQRTTQKQNLLLLIDDSRKTRTTEKATILPVLRTTNSSLLTSTSGSLFLMGSNSWAAEVNQSIITTTDQSTSTLMHTITTINESISTSTQPNSEITTTPEKSTTPVHKKTETTTAVNSQNPFSTEKFHQTTSVTNYQNFVQQLSSQIDSPLLHINTETNAIISGIYDSTNISKVLSAIDKM